MSDETDELLEAAISERDGDLVSWLLENGADPNAAIWNGEQHILYLAVHTGKTELVRLLLEAGAKVASELQDDETSLHDAAATNFIEIMELLLNADGSVALNTFDYIQRTPLMRAVKNGHLEIARMLIRAGADVNAHCETRIGDSALKIAVEKADVDMIELLLKAGADLYLPGSMGITPLDVAERWKRPDKKHLLELIQNFQRTGRFRL